MADAELIARALESLTRFLRANNLKMTKERRLILKEIFEEDEHLEAEDLLVRFRNRGERVSRATIYRTFDLFIQAGLIKKSDFGHDHYHYEKSFGLEHHDHLICRRCGKVIEFNDPELENLQREICKKRGFTMHSHTLQIFGFCADCKA